MSTPKLFMIMLGCKPQGRHTEQHDIFFGIGNNLKDLVQQIYDFWPEANEKIHIDAWREVNQVNNFKIEVVPIHQKTENEHQLYFLNLGGYLPDEFDEPHYRMLITATDKATAIREAKNTAFYKHTCFDGAVSHIDDKYGVDVDDAFDIEDVLADDLRKQFRLRITPTPGAAEDDIHLGYLPVKNI